jgi:hypothetical protein
LSLPLQACFSVVAMTNVGCRNPLMVRWRDVL